MTRFAICFRMMALVAVRRGPGGGRGEVRTPGRLAWGLGARGALCAYCSGRGSGKKRSGSWPDTQGRRPKRSTGLSGTPVGIAAGSPAAGSAPHAHGVLPRAQGAPVPGMNSGTIRKPKLPLGGQGALRHPCGGGQSTCPGTRGPLGIPPVHSADSLLPHKETNLIPSAVRSFPPMVWGYLELEGLCSKSFSRTGG